MGIKSGEFTFQLSRSIEYNFDGGKHTADSITLREPGMEHVSFYLRLKQMLTRSQMELANKAKDIEEAVGEVVKPIQEAVDEIESQNEEIYTMYKVCLETSEKVDAGTFLSTFKKMCVAQARKGVCMVDGRRMMTEALWNELTPDDAYNMALRWCSFFAMPSIEGEKNESEQQPDSPTERTEV